MRPFENFTKPDGAHRNFCCSGHPPDFIDLYKGAGIEMFLYGMLVVSISLGWGSVRHRGQSVIVNRARSEVPTELWMNLSGITFSKRRYRLALLRTYLRRFGKRLIQSLKESLRGWPLIADHYCNIKFIYNSSR